MSIDDVPTASFLAHGSVTGTERGTLHLLVGDESIRDEAMAAMAEAGHVPNAHGGLISVAVESGTFDALVRRLSLLFSGPDAQAVPVVFQKAGTPLDIASCMGASSFDSLSAQVESRWLRNLIAARRVTTVFQPIVHAHNPSEIFAYECLLRGLGPDGELLPPEPILNLAKRAGWLEELDRTARRSAIEAAAHHGVEGLVFVNMSPVSLLNPEVTLRESLEMIDSAGLARNQVVFEVVESEKVECFDELRDLVKAYRAEGCQVALDDLGSGYASLRLLAELRPDFVKIDMSLVRNVHRDRWRGTVVTGIIQLAKELGMRTIAEGVESASEMRWLQERGAEFLQGFYLATPAHPPPSVRDLSSGRRVLLVDDSEAARRIAERVLRAAGFDVRIAEGVHALSSVLRGWTPDIVLTDVKMPEVSSDDVGRIIKKSLPNASIPVLLFSSMSQDKLERLSNHCGADGYVCKADGVENLIDRLQQLREEILW